MRTIQSVTHEGITYLDDDGESKFLDLIACNQNWIERERAAVKEISTYDEKFVAFRNVFGNPPYLLFFTESDFSKAALKFVFESEDALYKVLSDLRLAKWLTIDLS